MSTNWHTSKHNQLFFDFEIEKKGVLALDFAFTSFLSNFRLKLTFELDWVWSCLLNKVWSMDQVSLINFQFQGSTEKIWYEFEHFLNFSICSSSTISYLLQFYCLQLYRMQQFLRTCWTFMPILQTIWESKKKVVVEILELCNGKRKIPRWDGMFCLFPKPPKIEVF